MTKKKIAIIEDMPLLNSMMQKLLSDHFEIVSVSNSALDMMRICDTYIPDLVLTDIVTKDGINGIVYGGKVTK